MNDDLELDIYVDRKCNPWSAPLIIYIILVLINVFNTIASIYYVVKNKNNGKIITQNQKWWAIVISTVIYLIIAFLFGSWIYRLSLNCEQGKSWLVLLLAIFFPFILMIIIAALVAIIIL